MAGTITVTVQNVKRTKGRCVRIKYACTADASDGSYPTSSTDDVEYEDGTLTDKIAGMQPYQLYVDPGSTGPTADSDMTITEGTAGVDILDGNGTDIIKNSASTATYFGVDGVALPVIIDEALTLTISNNSVNSATIAIYLYLVSSWEY